MDNNSLDIEQERSWGCNWDAENSIRMNSGYMRGIVCVCFIDWQKVFDLFLNIFMGPCIVNQI